MKQRVFALIALLALSCKAEHRMEPPKPAAPGATDAAALAAIRKVATRVESETVSGDDVTQEFVDLESQVRNLEAAEIEMRQLMTTVRERTKKASDILEVYQELVQLRGQIETAKGRM